GMQIAAAAGLRGPDLFAAITPGFLALFALMFLLGYFLYGSFFAAIGSVVSRVEDAGQAVLPITMLLVLEFVFGILTLLQPSGTLAEVLSFIPLFTPTVLLARTGMVGVPPWQTAIAISLLLAGTIAAGWLCSRIYRIGVTLYARRPGLRDLARLLRTQ
ncbi:MAG: ABC transporter permease, partial [Firmicutes bacterium]|nr:ABC transporter permease [Bacillota bacterium]